MGMNISYCQPTVNSIHQCWPPTSAGQFAKLPCPSNVTGFHYSENDDSFRECFLNGSWAEFADYSACSIIYPVGITVDKDI
ncbi:Corticotropin-releasing factor receptor 2 [Schistosoma japonicum]|nr:Corticotropin-releasing factor receptor 2 [Schistosoma japonicum]